MRLNTKVCKKIVGSDLFKTDTLGLRIGFWPTYHEKNRKTERMGKQLFVRLIVLTRHIILMCVNECAPSRSRSGYGTDYLNIKNEHGK